MSPANVYGILSSQLQSDRTLPIYIGIYAAKKRGSLRGDALLSNLATSDATGSLFWDKPPQPSGIYATGFSTTLTLTASRYIPPLASRASLPSATPCRTRNSSSPVAAL